MQNDDKNITNSQIQNAVTNQEADAQTNNEIKGDNTVKNPDDWTTGAEDFSFFGAKVPSFFFFIGGMKKGQDPKTAAAHHTPDFMIDDSRLDVGIKAFANIVFDYQ